MRWAICSARKIPDGEGQRGAVKRGTGGEVSVKDKKAV